jgi:histidyl-tRNA synthetase
MLKDYLKDSEIGLKGITELEYVFDTIKTLGLNQAKLDFEVTLARGLNYYTGAIFEVTANNVKIGSICGGGRYDDLTALFGLSGMSGVGISFGADRIFDVLTELDLFPKSVQGTTQYLFINFGENEQLACMKIAKKMRDRGVACEVYPESKAMKKQMKYANDRAIPFVLLMGSEEIEKEMVTLKNMETGEQESIAVSTLINGL